jgi:AcrR family transcriptional regulator
MIQGEDGPAPGGKEEGGEMGRSGDAESIQETGPGFVDASVPADLRERVLAAGLDELSHWGIERFSVGALAARHGIDESLIVKYWGDSQRLTLDLLLRWDSTTEVVPDTGSLRSDLKAAALSLAAYVNTSLGRKLLRALVMEDGVRYSDDTRTVFWLRRFTTLRVVMDRAIERGELREGVGVVTAVQLLVAPINVRALFTAEPVGEQYCEEIADLVWHALKR